MKRIVIVTEGRARCTYEPRGASGLEGYQRGLSYAFKCVRMNKKKHFRVYPGQEFKDNQPTPTRLFCADPEYYETTGPNTFRRYFEIIDSRPYEGEPNDTGKTE